MAGRPRIDRRTIVAAGEVLGEADIRAESWRISTLSDHLRTPEAAMVWLARRKLLKNEMMCTVCNVPCQLQLYSQGADGKRWSCELCSRKISVRDGSFFTRSHLSLEKIALCMYCFSQDFPQNVTMAEADIPRGNTVVDWFNFCREDIGVFLERHATEIGGFGEIVEIDETKYFHRKYHRGQWRDGHWVFGGVERGSGRCFLVEVLNRTAATLEAEILRHILPGTRIMSDGWAAYRNIPQLANGIYEHSVVVHERNFVYSDDDEVHTQNIENLWMRAPASAQEIFLRSSSFSLLNNIRCNHLNCFWNSYIITTF